ncbi:MAG: Uma2 family endonuclease [Polyangiaceae bacterium]
MSRAAITIPPEQRPMTIEQWAALDEDEEGELVDGRLVEEEASDSAHQVIVMWLTSVLLPYLQLRNGRLLGSESKFAVSPRRGRKPDLSVYLSRDQKLPRTGPLRVPPDIIIEVVSPTPRDGRRDRVEKTSEYAAFGARWYWLVDPRLRTVEILGLGADGDYAIRESAAGGSLAVPGCDGLVLDLDAMWRELDDALEDPPAGAPEH